MYFFFVTLDRMIFVCYHKNMHLVHKFTENQNKS